MSKIKYSFLRFWYGYMAMQHHIDELMAYRGGNPFLAMDCWNRKQECQRKLWQLEMNHGR